MTVLVLACLVGGAVTFGTGEGAEFRGGALVPPRPAPDFTLKTTDGTEFRLSAQRDRVVALSFGYTFCPDVCPTTLAALVQVKARLAAEADRLRVVFITVDPERDTPVRLQEYARAFSHRFTPLTGTPDTLGQARKAYGVVAEKRVVSGTAATYLIDHSALVYVIDPQGRLRLTFPFGLSVDDMTHDIKLLLRRSTRERLYVIPQGTAARQAAGEDVRVLPTRIRLTIGVQDVLVLRNDDIAAQSVGPARIEPGQSYRLPLRAPIEFALACSAHEEGQLTIVAQAAPSPGPARLRWRLEGLFGG